MLAKLYEVFVAEDATLVEVNPLLVTGDRQVVALDAKVTLDGNALYRHPDSAALRDSAPTRTRRSAWRASAGSPTSSSTATSASSATAPGW